MSFTFKVDGVDLPTPGHDNFKIGISDADSAKTNRNAKAYLNRDLLRSGMRKLTVTYPFLSQAESKLILDTIKPRGAGTRPKVFMDVTYLDPQLGVVTLEMYVGDMELPMYGKNSKGEYRWKDLSFNLIER